MQFTIKQKLTIMVGVTVLGLLAMLARQYVVLVSIRDIDQYRLLSQQLNVDMIHMRQNALNLILRQDPKFIGGFEKAHETVLKKVQKVRDFAKKNGMDDRDFSKLDHDLASYVTMFHQRVNAGLNTEKTAGIHVTGADMLTLKQLRDSAAAAEADIKQIGQMYDVFLTQQSHSLIAVGMGIFAVIFLIVLFGGIFMSRGIIGPLKILQDIMNQANKDKDLTVRAHLKGKDEITDMATTFNTMLGAFQEMVTKVVDAVHQVSMASSELSAVTQQTADGVMKQHRESDMVAAAMNQMTATVQDVSRNASQASDASLHADDAALKGKTIVDDVKRNIDALSHEIETTAQSINHLQEQTVNIGSVLNVIRDIADQTNLLALNAAIEAARAGEQGRGFAVVADEVRTLANRTQESTTEIQSIIENLQEAARKAVTTMESGTEMTRRNVQQAGEADIALDEITAAVKAITDMNAMIASAAEEQTSVADEINRSVTNIASISDETAQGATHVTATADNLAGLASHLQGLSSQFTLGSAHVDLTAAKTAHLSWKARIRSFLDGKEGLTMAQAVSHHDCVLGKWYYSEGMEKYGYLQEMRDLEAPHAKLHATIREIIELKERGETRKADELSKEINTLSGVIVGYLEAIEQKAS